MGFGFAAMIASPVMGYLIDSFGIANTFYIMGATYFVIMLSASLYLERPPEGYHPSGIPLQEQPKKNKDYVQLTANEAVKTRRFYFLWLMLFINITCGIAILAVASPMGQEVAGLSVKSAAIMVGIMGVFKDKEYEKIVQTMGPLMSVIYAVDLPDEKRGLPSEKLEEMLEKYCPCVKRPDVSERQRAVECAVRASLLEAGKEDVILAFGSLSYLQWVKDAYEKAVW